MLSKKIEDKKGPLYDMFFGKLQREIAYEKQGKEFVSSTYEEEFMSVFLNPTVAHEMYSAWDREFSATCELTVEGELKNANSNAWITDLPKSLLFSIQRAQAGESGDNDVVTKVNKKFEFEETIYPDRYMLKNKEESLKIRAKVSGLRAKIEKIDKSLDSFENYKESELSVLKFLE